MHIAIIAEYNPFHCGHEYQIRELRRIFGDDTAITVILGGIFSQRGEPYIAPPYVRAEAAVKCGADLALEMPFPFSAAPATVFARAGVEIAEKIGADILAFGSECGDADTLMRMLARLDSNEFREAVAKREKDANALGKTRLYTEVYRELYGDDGRTDMPNDILAIEYMRNIKQRGNKLHPFAILRKGDYKSGEGEFASASSLRRDCGENGFKALGGKIPDGAYEVFEKAYADGLFFADIEKLASAVILKLCEPQGNVAYSGGGLLERLQNAASGAKSIGEVLSNAATKRYTDAEISRCMLYSLLSVSRNDMDKPVRYTRLLAANSRGRGLLATSKIELVTKPSAFDKLSPEAKAQYEKTFSAERAYALCLGGEYKHLRQSPRIVE